VTYFIIAGSTRTVGFDNSNFFSAEPAGYLSS
jgi:hypothetical protein